MQTLESGRGKVLELKELISEADSDICSPNSSKEDIADAEELRMIAVDEIEVYAHHLV